MRKTLFFLTTVVVSTAALAKSDNTQFPNKTVNGFIENKGQITNQDHQANPGVKYLLNTPSLNVQLRANGFSYDTYVQDKQELPVIKRIADAAALRNLDKPVTRQYHRIDIGFDGANAQPEIVAEGVSADYLNYYLNGGDVTNVHSYEKVTYKNVYPGIDLEFIAGAAGKPVEYNFIVHPGADASQIRLHYNGAGTRLENDHIVIATSHGELKERIPASYIQGTHEPVAVIYRQAGNGVFGYDVPAYDRTKTLIIDPTPDLAWGTYYGGTGEERGFDVDIDGSDVYLTGVTTSSTSIATSGAYQTSISSQADAFIAKFNKAGARQWATYYGNTGSDVPQSISVVNGIVWMAGQTNSTSGMSSLGSYQSVYGGGYDGFMVRFTSGGTFQYSTYLGGSQLESISSITIDNTGSGYVYVTGYTASSTGMPISGSTQSALGGATDAFLVKFSITGFPLWGTYAGSTNLDEGYNVATDASGNVFISGLTYFPTNNNLVTPGAYQTTFAGDSTDFFIEKYNGSGVRQWGTYFGGPAGEERNNTRDLAVDASGNVYLVGGTFSTSGIATIGAFKTSPPTGGDEDGFIAKFNSSGAIQWATYFGGSQPDAVLSVGTDPNGNVYMLGGTFSNGLSTSNAYQTSITVPNPAPDLDAFVTKLNSSGQPQWSTYYGDVGSELGYGMDVDATGNVYVTGLTSSVTGLASSNAHQTTTGGGLFDAFLARFRACNSATVTATTTKTDVTCYGAANGQITVNATGGSSPYRYQLGSTPVQTSNSFTGLSTGNYSITVIDDNDCASTLLNIVISQPVQITTPTLAGSTTVKQNNTENYSTPAQTGAIYLWTVTGGNITTGQGTNQVQVKWTQAGNREVKVKVSGSATSTCPDSATMSVLVNFPDAVKDVTLGNIQVYPNPASGIVHISLANTPAGEQLQLFSSYGQLMLQQPLQKEQQVNISHLAPGIYYFSIGTKHVQFVKE